MTPEEQAVAEKMDARYGVHVHTPMRPLQENGDGKLVGYECARCGDLFTAAGTPSQVRHSPTQPNKAHRARVGSIYEREVKQA